MMFRKVILNGILMILVLAVTYLGLGPVLFADGTNAERIYTFLIVLVIYIFLGIAFYFVNRRSRT